MKKLIFITFFSLFIIQKPHCQNIQTVKKKQSNNNFESILNKGSELQSRNPDSAISYFKHILVAKDFKLQSLDKAELLKRLAVCFHSTGQYDSALFYYNIALSIRSDYEDKNDSANSDAIARLYNNIALLESYKGNIEKSINYYRKSSEIWEKLADTKSLANFAYSNLGGLYFDLGNYSAALEFFYKILYLCEKNKDTSGVANAYDLIGAAYFEQRDYAAAKVSYEKALKLREKAGDEFLLSYSYTNLGNLYQQMQKYSHSLNYYQKSLPIKEKYKDLRGLGNIYHNIGIVYKNLQAHDSALYYLEKSVQYRKIISDMRGIASSYITMGSVFNNLNKIKESEKMLLEGYAISKQYGYKALLSDAAELLSILYYKKRDFQNAFNYLKQHIELKDSLMNEKNIKMLTQLEMQHLFDKKLFEDSIKKAELIAKKEFEHKENIQRQRYIIWFIVIATIFAGILGILAFRSYRIKQQAKENMLKQKSVELEKNLLRSQMNPHFIFNSLNSIQHYVLQNDSNSAEKYLSKFARLIRNILENSMHTTISLEKDIETLKLYLDLERLRFNEKFDYTIDIAEEIECDEIHIPPMLLQPFVENAILHGIKDKEDKGLIEIAAKLDKEKKYLKCTISDNGIGIRKSAELKPQDQKKKHKSVGIQLTQERLLQLQYSDKKEQMISVAEKINERGTVCGTIVSLLIPYTLEAEC